MTTLGVFGAGGRMGQRVLECVAAWPTLRLAAAASRGSGGAAALAECDVVIDFSAADATDDLLDALGPGTALVTGTTGRDGRQIAAVEARAAAAPVFVAANFSLGVAVLTRLVEQATRGLGEQFDIEVAEIHHRQKADAPSGTALQLGRAAAEARGLPWPAARLPAREGLTGARPAGTVGFAAIRGSDVVGEHTVYFFGEGERLELTHKAADRRLFAHGALRAAQWLAGRPAGLYGMRDLLDDIFATP